MVSDSPHVDRLALSNHSIVSCFLVHGANPDGSYFFVTTVTTRAAYAAPLFLLKLLLDHGGIAAGTDIVALAAIDHNEGIPGQLEVVEYLLNAGAPINA